MDYTKNLELELSKCGLEILALEAATIHVENHTNIVEDGAAQRKMISQTPPRQLHTRNIATIGDTVASIENISLLAYAKLLKYIFKFKFCMIFSHLLFCSQCGAQL